MISLYDYVQFIIPVSLFLLRNEHQCMFHTIELTMCLVFRSVKLN